MKEIISNSEEETFVIATNFAKDLRAPCLIGIEGKLGAGKTTFVKFLGDTLGVKELITSPTFLGISEYYSGQLPLIHMDFYMKVAPKDQINDYLSKNSIVIIEWINNYKLTYGEDLKSEILINIESIDDHSRKFSIRN